MHGTRLATFCVFIVLSLLHVPAAAAEAEAVDHVEYHFVPVRAATYELATAEGKLLEIAMPAWGPDWSWFEYPNEPRMTDGGARLLDATRPIGGTEVDLQLHHRVQADAEQSDAVVLEHKITAAEESDLQMVAVGVTAEADAFARLEVERPNGVRERFGIPLRGNEPNGEAIALTYLTEEEQPVKLAFDAPREIRTDDQQVRIILAAEHIEGDSPQSLVTRLTTPQPVRFYALTEQTGQHTDTADWFAYPVGKAGTPVDLSFLNKDEDGEYIPAGSHGFLQVKGDRFVFEDGTEARFWGVNLTAGAALAGGRRAEQLAERLARLGVNVVRLHHLDSWHTPIVDYDHRSGTSQHLDEASMRKLDRLIYELKQRGIYIILDPWVQRTFTEWDEVAAHDELGSGNFHLHPYIFFDDRMRELHKKFMRQVWNHVNEHTGLAYKDDPAFVMTGVANEALMQRGANHVKLEPYRSDFLQRYRDWARAHDADAEAGERVISQNWPRDHQRFYIHLMRDFYEDMHSFFREEVGLRIPINASNWFRWHWEIVSQQTLDYMDAHMYYDGSQIGSGDGLGGLWTEHPPHEIGTPFGRLGAMHLHGKPLLLSELGHNPPKTYRSAYYPGLAAVAALQGWDAITPFAYSQSANEPATHLSGRFQGAYEFEADPATIASLAAAALIYRRGDVRPAKRNVLMHVDDDHMFDFHHSERQGLAYENTGLFNALLETHRVSIHLGDEVPADVADSVDRIVTAEQAADAYNADQAELRSDTGELWRDWQRGIGTIDSPRTQAAYGRLGSHEPLQTRDVTFAIDTPFATVSLSSLEDGRPIRRSSRLLLTAVARAENTDMAFDITGSRIVELGKAPMLAEPVVGTLTVRSNRAGYRLYPIAVDGSRGEAVDVPVRNGRATFNLRADHQTLFYEIEAVDDDAAALEADLPHRMRHLAARQAAAGRVDLAIFILDHAMALHPDPRTTAQHVAIVEAHQLGPGALTQALRAHLRVDRDDQAAQLRLIRVLTERAEDDQRAATLRRVLDRDGDRSLAPELRSRVALDLAELLLERGERGDALRALATGVELDGANLAAAELLLAEMERAGASEDRLERARQLRARAMPAADAAAPAFEASLVHDDVNPTQPARVSLTLRNPTDRPLGIGEGQPLPRQVTLRAAGRDDLPPLRVAVTDQLRIKPGASLTHRIELQATEWATLWQNAGCEPIELTLMASYGSDAAAEPEEIGVLHVRTWRQVADDEAASAARRLARQIGSRTCDGGNDSEPVDIADFVDTKDINDRTLAWAISFAAAGSATVDELRQAWGDKPPVATVLLGLQAEADEP